MTLAQPTVVRAAPHHEDALGAALADAFRDDPVFEFLIPADVKGREARLLAYFRMTARSYLRRDKHAFIAGEGRGGALWAAPGGWRMPVSEIVRETPAVMKVFGRNTFRALKLLTQVEGLHPKEPHHWYLGYLGTRCDSQGKGIGSAMLTEVLAQADDTRTPAYLESSNQRNLTLYERHGFRVVEEIKALGTGPSIYRMWRDPAS